MVSKPVYIVSDVHLGAVPPATEASFRRWLLHVKESGSRLVINGDLFDFWFEYRRVVLSEHVRVLALLADLVESGVPVLHVGGNRDWWGGAFLREELGIDFRREPARVELAGRTVLVAHGDGLGGGDLGYRCLRRILRARATRGIFRWIHPDIGARLARQLASVGRASPGAGANPDARTAESVAPSAEADVRGAESRQPGTGPTDRHARLREWASRRIRRDAGLDIVAAGHVHRPALVEVEPGRYYVNSGDWVQRRSYVTLDASGPPALHEWEARAASDDPTPPAP